MYMHTTYNISYYISLSLSLSLHIYTYIHIYIYIYISVYTHTHHAKYVYLGTRKAVYRPGGGTEVRI